MPQVRKHISNAQRQAAYRRRRKQDQRDALVPIDLPAIPKLTVRIPREGVHRFRAKAYSDSARRCAPIPLEGVH